MIYILGSLAGFILNGTIFGLIAEITAINKGYDRGFGWGFWLGLIGVIVIACRPNISAKPKPACDKNALPILDWTCWCGSKNTGRLDYCPICRRTRLESERAKDIQCPRCGTVNNGRRKVCLLCEQPLIPNAAFENDWKAIELLEKLAELHEQCILTDEEFRLRKACILAKL